MKVLYIGNYRDGTGWANACINNILALDSAGVNVVPRAITFETQQQDYPSRIKELSKNPPMGVMFVFNTRFHIYILTIRDIKI